MDYSTQYRPASFRGIDFFVPDESSEGGRRSVRHEFPGRDQNEHEDLGEATATFTIQAIIYGDNFLNDAKAFEDALLAKGPGTLIHPYYGQLQVVTPKYKRETSNAAIGEIRFSITAEKDGAALYPKVGQDTASRLTSAGDNAIISVTTTFGPEFFVPGDDFSVADALGRINDFTAQLQSTLAHYGVLSLVNGDWVGALNTLTGGLVNEVVGTFTGFVSIFTPLLNRLVGSDDPQPTTGRQAVTMVKALTAAASHSVAISAASTAPGQAIRVTNAAAIDYLNRTSALAAAVQIARYADYDSREQAVAIRSALADQADALQMDLMSSGWDDTAAACGLLMGALNRDINERLGRLPLTISFTPKAVLASYVLAQRLYGDDPASLFANAGDIVQRNGVRNPAFIPAATLEVLIDG